MTAQAQQPLHDPAQVDAIVRAEHGDPFGFLGLHRVGDRMAVRAFLPGASAVDLIDNATGKSLAKLERMHDAGFFAAEVTGRDDWFAYHFAVDYGDRRVDVEDPYRFAPILGDLDVHLMGEGRHLRLYDKLGAHVTEAEGVQGTFFAVWAPSARRVSVVGDFNNWDGRVHMMRLRYGAGVWEIFVPGVGAGARYKYEIRGPNGEHVPLKADPVGFSAEQPPATASMVTGLPEHEWRDADWLDSRAGHQALDAPISVYEVHLGSWMRGEDNRYLTYDEMADRLIPYVKEMGFTHIEMMPVSEFPFDGSWGYQPVGLFAPTSRFGGPEAFQRLIEAAHQAGIGVMIDWVPGHFPTDAHGLGGFDGTSLYEHADPRQGFHPDWNTLIYNYGRREVANFLLSNALYWFDRYHIDGLRVDAVASMLYLDYSRKSDEWVPNKHGGRENLEAIDLLRDMNTEVFGQFPGATTVAEESTAWPGVSRPVYTGGLGFGYKWNMGWMHDTLQYMSKDPIHRRHHHNDMTFGLIYAFSENFILPLSHDEVVHGKGSLVNKMPGDEWQKFANLRAYYGYMWSHPGKKLLFMGGEIAQWREWNHNHSLDWHLLEQEYWGTARPHEGMRKLIADLNHFYRATPAMHVKDCDPDGFEWIEGGDAENSVLSFMRKGREGDKPVVIVANFTPMAREGYRVGLPFGGNWREVINTDSGAYGGSNVVNAGSLSSDAIGWSGRGHSVALTLPPLGTIMLMPDD